MSAFLSVLFFTSPPPHPQYTTFLSGFKSVQPCLLSSIHPLLLQPSLLQAENPITLRTVYRSWIAIPPFHLFKGHLKPRHPIRPSLFLKPGSQKHLLQPNLSSTGPITNYHPMCSSTWTIPNFQTNLNYTPIIPDRLSYSSIRWK